MTARKGILLAGGSGSRLWPITMGVSKQLMPIYDKPMIYYPLSVLMLAGIREIALITTPEDQAQFHRLLGDGSQWGLSLTGCHPTQPRRAGAGLLLAEDFLDGAPSAMVLGDNIFFGHGLPQLMAGADARRDGGTVFGYHVSDPERYGVVGFDADGRAREIIEKPVNPPSRYAVTGLYFPRPRRAPPRARRFALGARRVGDHIASGNLSQGQQATGRDHGARLCVARHRHPWQPARRGQFRAHPAGPPGPANRLPRRDRL